MQAKRAVALGMFDGIHIGHSAVISATVEYRDRGFIPCVLVFDVHPMALLSKDPPPELMTYSQKVECIKALNAEIIAVKFADIAELSYEDFFEEYLIKRLNARVLCCGYNYRFGKGGNGNTALLRELCGKRGIELKVIDEIDIDGEPVSSTRIRNLLQQGNVALANKLLGRCFAFDFPVVQGDGRGHEMETPTINQLFPENFILPKPGVYSSFVEIDGREFPSVTNIGTCPTFDGTEMRSETFIIDYVGDLYNRNVTVRLTDYLREEKKFESRQALIDQIQCDIKHSLRIFDIRK
ncbi:MAG: bifunctional riboflavin kinase/FAD synthetase [Clostridiales bacterium]|nr:bifunctional riboflavin kinase/FAD synthetase [Clostridiales bacterium]